jgi:Putative serine esterase (DUF676)
MSETQGSGGDSSASSDVVDSLSEELCGAASFTILIHGVGDETSQDLLTGAQEGYLASGFGNNPVHKRTLSECPALSKEKGAEAILIKGETGNHFVIALPWNNRRRLASVALNCLKVLALMMTMTAAAYVVDNNVSGNLHGSWNSLLFGSSLKIFHVIGHKWRWGFLLLAIFSFAQWTATWWAPWLWIFACLLVLTLWFIASNVIIRCIPIARTRGWKLILWMLVLAVAVISVASIHSMWFVSKKISTDNLSRPGPADLFLIDEIYATYLDRKTAELKTSKVLPPALTQDDPQVKEPDSRNKIGAKIDSSTTVKPDPTLNAHSDFVACLFFILICIFGIVLTDRLGWLLDLGLDVLNYGGDEHDNAKMFGRLIDAIRWLNSKAPNAHLTVVAHSLGSVIASQAMSSISDSAPLPSQITLITLGSPLNYLYQVLPNVVKTPRELSVAICSKARWINLWRRSDEIGRELDVEPGVLVQYCIGKGHHPNYWSDGAVWRAVVYESLKVGEPPRDLATCSVEVHLELTTALAIVSLTFFGIVVWYRPNLIFLPATVAMLFFIISEALKYRSVLISKSDTSSSEPSPGNES